MEDQNNQNAKIEENISPKIDYYSTTGKKIFDFFMGFFGSLTILILYSFLASFFGYDVFSSGISFFINFSVSIVFILGLCILSFKVGRKFIAVGIISMVLIPLILFGGCFLLLSGF